MLSVPGVYQNGSIILLENIPTLTRARVIVTVLEEWPEPLAAGGLLKIEDESPPEAWLGALANTATIVGDIVQPLDETLADWEILRV
ncbi:MAG: hypothetical protein ACOYNY_37130 [Caldilineaceae bacterium]|jgi:hypothetical protein